MRRALATVFACCAMSVAALAAGKEPSLQVVPGDFITQQSPDGSWAVIQILAVDTWPDGSKAAHCRTLENSRARPDMRAVEALKTRVGHAPIDAASFGDWQKVGSRPVTRADQEGFEVYLKLTDFPRYLELTGQSADKIVGRAHDHYLRANALGDSGKRREAIAAYDEAIDLFPLFYEAIDNRAFTLMELGDYRSALGGFEDSLRVNPEGFAAVFSHAECLLRLGEFEKAEAEFKAGANQFPERRAQFDRFADMARRRVKP
jgi:tetratricopeptide (TPR) repeat protein